MFYNNIDKDKFYYVIAADNPNPLIISSNDALINLTLISLMLLNYIVGRDAEKYIVNSSRIKIGGIEYYKFPTQHTAEINNSINFAQPKSIRAINSNFFDDKTLFLLNEELIKQNHSNNYTIKINNLNFKLKNNKLLEYKQTAYDKKLIHAFETTNERPRA